MTFLVFRGELNLISQMQSAVGTDPQIISCGGGWNADVLKALYQDQDRQASLQCLFCFESIDIKKLTYEPSYSVLAILVGAGIGSSGKAFTSFF